jgi:hypothetical protein
MQPNGDYISVLNNIRSQIQTLNAQLDTYKEHPVSSLLTIGVAHDDKALIELCHKKTATMQFVASVNEFAFHWETMTRDQHIKYLHDYVETEYSSTTDTVKTRIKAFLEQEVVNKKSGYRHVQWNGYFIEKLPELQIHVDSETDKSGTTVSIKFKPPHATDESTQKATKKNTHLSFGVMRAKLQREKKDFFV